MEEEKVVQEQTKYLVRKVYYRKNKVWGLEMLLDTLDLNGNKQIDWYPVGESNGATFVISTWKGLKELNISLKKTPSAIIDNVIIIKE